MKNTRNLKASSQNKIFFQAVHISIFIIIYDLKHIFHVQIIYIVEQSVALIVKRLSLAYC